MEKFGLHQLTGYICSSHVCKNYVKFVIGLEHLKSFDLWNMKSKVILIFCLFATSQGAVPRDRFAICTFFPEQCLSTKPSEGTTLHSNFQDSDLFLVFWNSFNFNFGSNFNSFIPHLCIVPWSMSKYRTHWRCLYFIDKITPILI